MNFTYRPSPCAFIEAQEKVKCENEGRVYIDPNEPKLEPTIDWDDVNKMDEEGLKRIPMRSCQIS